MRIVCRQMRASSRRTREGEPDFDAMRKIGQGDLDYWQDEP